MPYPSLALAVQLLASDKMLAEAAVPADVSVSLVQRDSDSGSASALSVWMPIVAEGSGRPVSISELRRIAKATEEVVSTEKPTFVVDNLRAGRPRALGHDGGLAGVEDVPGFDISISVFAAASIPPDLQEQLRAAVTAIENYFESTL